MSTKSRLVDQININIRILTETATINHDLLINLQSEGVLSRSETANLLAIQNKEEKFRRLYELLQTRHGGYVALSQALLQTNQQVLQSHVVYILPEHVTRESLYAAAKAIERNPERYSGKNRISVYPALPPSPPSNSTKKSRFIPSESFHVPHQQDGAVAIVNTIDAELTMEKISVTLAEKCVCAKQKNLDNLKNRMKYFVREETKKVLRRLSTTDSSSENRCHVFLVNKSNVISIAEQMVQASLPRTIMLVTTKSNYEKNLLSSPYKNKIFALNDTFEWTGISREFQKVLMKRLVLDQGELRTLKDVLSSFVYEKRNDLLNRFLREQLLVDLIRDKNPVIFRQTIPQCPFSLPRTLLTRDIVSRDIFVETKWKLNQNVVLIVSGIRKAELSYFGGGISYSEYGKRGLLQSNIIVVEPSLNISTGSTSIIEDLCANGKKFVHWLEYKQKGQFKWIVSCTCSAIKSTSNEGKMSIVQRAVECDPNQEEVTETTLLSNARNRKGPIILCGEPGMGKSILLGRLARAIKTVPDVIVIFAEMKSFMASLLKKLEVVSAYNQGSSDGFRECVQRQLLSCVTAHNLDTGIFELRCARSVEIFFDGVDEVNIEYFERTMECIKVILELPSVRVYLATRPHLLYDIENSLNAVAYTIKPFTPDEQVQFLVKYWSQDLPPQNTSTNWSKMQEFAQFCLKQFHGAQRVQTNNNDCISSIPFQCMIISEMYQDQARSVVTACSNATNLHEIPGLSTDVSMSILELCEGLVSRKFEVFIRKYWKKSHVSPEAIKDALFKFHVLLSVKELVHDFLFWHSALQKTLLNVSVENILKLVLPSPSHNDVDLPSEILGIGLIVGVGDNLNTRFVHQAIAEYFVASIATNQRNVDNSLKSFIEMVIFKTMLCVETKIEGENCVSEKVTQFCFPGIVHFVDISLAKNVNTVLDRFDQESVGKMALACIHGNYLYILQHLINYGQLHNLDDDVVYSLQLYATKTASIDILKCICSEFHINPCRFLDATTLLHVAVQLGDFSKFDYLLNCCGFVNYIKQGTAGLNYSNLFHVCVANSKSLSDEIIMEKVDILEVLTLFNPSLTNMPDSFEKPPILQQNIHVKLLLHLIENGADVLKRDKFGRSVLHNLPKYLSPEEYLQILNKIEEHNLHQLEIIIDQRDKCGWTPLHNLVRFMEPTDKALRVFSKYFYEDEPVSTGILWTAIQHGREIGCLNLLQKCGATFRMIDEFCRTPLHIATRYSTREVVLMFIEFGIDLESQDEDGNTPVFHALFNSQIKEAIPIVRLLKQRGANLCHTNANGETLCHVATQIGNLELLCSVVNMSALLPGWIHEKDLFGNAPLHHALKHSYGDKLSVVKYLVSEGATAEFKNEMGECALEFGLRQQFCDISRCVLDYLEQTTYKLQNWEDELVELALQHIDKFGEERLKEKQFISLEERIIAKRVNRTKRESILDLSALFGGIFY